MQFCFRKKTPKSIRSNFLTRFFGSLFLELFWEFPLETHCCQVSIKKGNKKCMWPWKRLGLLCPSTEQKMPDTLRIIKGVGWGRGLYISTTSSKQKMYSRSVFYAYNFFCSWRPCGDLIPQKIYKNGHSKKQVMFLYKSGSCLRIVWIFHAVQLQGHNNKDKWLHNNKAYCFLSPSTLKISKSMNFESKIIGWPSVSKLKSVIL